MEGIRRAGTAREQAPSVVALFYVFSGLWDGNYVSQFPDVGYYFVVEIGFKHACEEYLVNV